MASSISKGEKNPWTQEKQWLMCKCIQAENVGLSSLQQSEAQDIAATDTRGVGPPCPLTSVRPLMQCRVLSDVMCARTSCPAHGVLDELPVGNAPSNPHLEANSLVWMVQTP